MALISRIDFEEIAKELLQTTRVKTDFKIYQFQTEGDVIVSGESSILQLRDITRVHLVLSGSHYMNGNASGQFEYSLNSVPCAAVESKVGQGQMIKMDNIIFNGIGGNNSGENFASLVCLTASIY